MKSVEMRPVRASTVVSREIAGETVLVPIHRSAADLESLFVLNEVASFVWERLDGQHTLRDIELAIVEGYDVAPEEARTDVQGFVAQLLENGLIQEA